MYYVSEKAVEQSVTQADITAAIERVFISLAKEDAANFPVVREKLNYADAIFGFKSGFDRSVPALGVKAGGLWPGNRAKGLANHQSTIVLFDPETGGPHALVRGTYLTALRTAAASALSIRHLSREGAATLGLLGAGGQAMFQVRAALGERAFKRVLICDAAEENAATLKDTLSDAPVDVDTVDPQTMAENSDTIITITPSFTPVIKAAWVRPGTHLACMGADTKGKQEVETRLLETASVFCDEPEQAVMLGESQHAYGAGKLHVQNLTTLGRVLSGVHQGRRDEAEITVFDSTGMGLQDLAAAQIALRAAIDQDLAVILPD